MIARNGSALSSTLQPQPQSQRRTRPLIRKLIAKQINIKINGRKVQVKRAVFNETGRKCEI